ncbi:hypothetical protein BZA77DRAFT_166502 [Pyronema omphalodes]|nr:hypothetical protein BZA77DRAFT_166502 [Pyronema omphalodes]
MSSNTQQQKPSGSNSESKDADFLNSVTDSARGLYKSIISASPSYTSNGLESLTSSSSKSSPNTASSSSSSIPAASSAWSESSKPRAPCVGAFTNTNLRSQTNAYTGPHSASTEEEYTYFQTAPATQNQTYLPPQPPVPQPSEYQDGAFVTSLLSTPITSAIYSDDLLVKTQITHPLVLAFASCDDPVAFLEQRPDWSQYTDYVWGDLREILEKAEKEVGKGKGAKEGEAVGQLRVAWGKIRAKL